MQYQLLIEKGCFFMALTVCSRAVADRFEIMIIAGEPSGDIIGQRLMDALSEQSDTDVRFWGVGGDNMLSSGLKSLFPMQELSVMGLTEVLPRLPRLLWRVREATAEVLKQRPDMVVTIDAPGFNFRVGKNLGNSGIPIVHYVAPTVWAWRPERAQKVASFLDHLLAILPFEPPYFEKVGLPCTYVGHPVMEQGLRGNGSLFRQKHLIALDSPLLALLPGSRRNEVKQLMPIFLDTVARLVKRYPSMRIVIPTVSNVTNLVQRQLLERGMDRVIVVGREEKASALDASNIGLTASGTATLELSMAKVPMVVAYRMQPITMAIVRRMVHVEKVCLVNLIANSSVIPEFLQERCTSANLSKAIDEIIADSAARKSQIQVFSEVREKLRCGEIPPSHRAAQVVLSILKKKRKV